MPEQTERSYKAFISYRHLPLDKQAAELIQKRIENYTIPKELRKDPEQKRLGFCFRDEDELPASSSLSESIYYALDHSEYLIVICTPDLPLSKWCEQEIRYFTRTHDRDHVLAVLADGTPDVSFPPLLLHEYDEDGNESADCEPLAANIASPDHSIDKKAFRKEIVRIYAALIGCPFDALWQREKRARTARLLSFAGVVLAAALVFLGVLMDRNAKIREKNLELASLTSVLPTSGSRRMKSMSSFWKRQGISAVWQWTVSEMNGASCQLMRRPMSIPPFRTVFWSRRSAGCMRFPWLTGQ